MAPLVEKLNRKKQSMTDNKTTDRAAQKHKVLNDEPTLTLDPVKVVPKNAGSRQEYSDQDKIAASKRDIEEIMRRSQHVQEMLSNASILSRKLPMDAPQSARGHNRDLRESNVIS